MKDPKTASVGRFDYVIVGAGSAGCVLANRLSADPRNRVLLLEAGGSDRLFWVEVPLSQLFTLGNPRTDWCFETESEPGLNARSIACPRGRLLGGCSSINGMLYVRGHARDYDRWRELGNVGWSWDEVLPFFKHSEDFEHGADEAHGAGGPWRVQEMPVRWELLDAIRVGASELGGPRSDDFNRGDTEGCGYFHVNQRAGRRWSAAKAFLHPVRRRPNLTVITGAQATRVRLSGRRASGVEFWRGQVLSSAEAEGEVILCAGAIGSPHLLQLSGIGPGPLLQQNGVAVHHELPGVGENLQDHLQLRPVFEVRNTPTLNERGSSFWGRLAIGLEYLLFRRGPFAMSPSQLGWFVRSGPSAEIPDLEFHLQVLSFAQLKGGLDPFPAYTAAVVNLQPTSRGQLRLKGPDARVHPSIRFNYLSTPEDQQVAIASLRLARRLSETRALAPFEPREVRPGPEARSDEELLHAAGTLGTTAFHPVGTCKMGVDDRAVVDPRLRVRGLERLRVVDGSIMPLITSGNTNSPTIMIAEKAAELMREDRLC